MKNNSIYSILREFFRFTIKKRKVQLVFIIISTLLSSFLELINIGAIIPLLSYIVSPDSFSETGILFDLFSFIGLKSSEISLIDLTIFFCISSIFSGLFRALTLFVQLKFGALVGNDFVKIVYKTMLNLPYNIQIKLNSSQNQTLIQKSFETGTWLVTPFVTLCGSIIVLSSISSFLLFLDIFTFLITILYFGIIYIIIVLLTKKTLKKSSESINKNHTNIFKSTRNGLGSIRNIIMESNSNLYVTRLIKIVNNFRLAWVNVNFINQSPKMIVETAGLIYISVLTIIYYNLGYDLENIVVTIGALALAAQKMLPMIQQVFGCYAVIKGNQHSILEVLDFLNSYQKFTNYSQQKNIEKIKFKNEIKFSDLSFSYIEDEPVIVNSNLSIKLGSKIAIVGSSGSGKSTLLDLLMGLISPSSGEIIIDNVILNPKNIGSWQKMITHVPQSVFLKDSSILSNIIFDHEDNSINKKRLQESISIASIDEFINNLEFGFNTDVGENGNLLSGGQRQRLGIARALYRNNKILIFDEATSALDKKTEDKVIDSLLKLDKSFTVILVSHKLSLEHKFDRVLNLEKTKIIDL